MEEAISISNGKFLDKFQTSNLFSVQTREKIKLMSVNIQYLTKLLILYEIYIVFCIQHSKVNSSSDFYVGERQVLK